MSIALPKACSDKPPPQRLLRLAKSEVGALVARGYLPEEARGDPVAIKVAIEGVISDRAFELEQEHPFVILAGEALEIVGIEKKIMMGRVGRSAYWLDHDPTGMQTLHSNLVGQNILCVTMSSFFNRARVAPMGAAIKSPYSHSRAFQ
jgi:hypothetical protein